MAKSNLNIVVWIIIVTGLIWCLLVITASQPKQTPTEIPAPIVTIVEAKYLDQPEMIQIYGKVESLDPISVDSELSAKIDSLPIKNGSNILKGDIIATFDSSDLLIEKESITESIVQHNSKRQSIVDQITSLKDVIEHDVDLLNNAKDLLARYKKLSSKFQSQQTLTERQDLVSQREKSLQENQNKQSTLEHQLDQIDSDITQDKIKLVDNHLDLEHTTLKSPADGIVSNLSPVVGDYVQKGSPLLTIIDPMKTYIHGFIPSQYFSQLQQGLNARLKTHPELKLTLNQFNPIVQPKSAHIDGRFNYTTPATSEYAIGQIVAMIIELPLDNATIQVPESSIYNDQYIYRINGDQLEKIRINIHGMTYQNGTHYLISNSDLNNGDQILVSRLSAPKTGLKVIINA